MNAFVWGVKIRYITSDCEAVAIIHERQGYAKTAEDAVADVLQAGILALHSPFYFYVIITYQFCQSVTCSMRYSLKMCL